MTMKRISKRITVRSRGSAPKKGARTVEVLDPKDWKVGMIAWNRDGNVVILDPKLGRYLRTKARQDKEFEMAISPTAVQVGDSSDGARSAIVSDPVNKISPINALCMCDVLRFHLDKEQGVRTKLLSSERMR